MRLFMGRSIRSILLELDLTLPIVGKAFGPSISWREG